MDPKVKETTEIDASQSPVVSDADNAVPADADNEQSSLIAAPGSKTVPPTPNDHSSSTSSSSAVSGFVPDVNGAKAVKGTFKPPIHNPSTPFKMTISQSNATPVSTSSTLSPSTHPILQLMMLKRRVGSHFQRI